MIEGSLKAMTARLITTPGGEKPAILPAEEFKDLCDQLAHAAAMADHRAGREEALTLEEVDALLASPTPLAKAAGATQPHVADPESGKHGGPLDGMARIAKALKIKLDDLAPPVGAARLTAWA